MTVVKEKTEYGAARMGVTPIIDTYGSFRTFTTQHFKRKPETITKGI